MFQNKFEKFKNRIALSDQKRKLKYSDLLRISKKFKKKISSKYLTFLVCDNDIDSVSIYTSLMNNGCPICLLDTNINKEDLLKLINLYSPKYIFIRRDQDINLHLPKYKCFKILKDYFFYENFNKINYKINKNIHLLLATSGSTNEPKFVKLSKLNILSNTLSIIKYLKISKDDISLTTMPMQYSYGLSVLNTHLLSGAKMIMNKDSIISKNFLKKVKKEKVSNLNGVPFSYEMLLRIGLNKIISNNLRLLTQAGGELNIELIKKIYDIISKKKISFYTMYGQTEASPRISYLKITKKICKYKKVPIGRPLRGTKIYVNKKKEIIFEGPNIYGGYSYKLSDLRYYKFQKKLSTNDIGFKNKLGEIFITGRRSRSIKLYGHRINLDYLEKKIEANFKCNAITLLKNNKIAIFADKKIKYDNLINLPQNILNYKYIENIPRTKNGKKNYKYLNQ